MQNISADRLAQLRTARRALEVDVARTIGKYLLACKSEYIRGLTLSMLKRMLDLFDRPSVGAQSILVRQQSFGMWSLVPGAGPNEKGLGRVYDFVQSWSNYDWLLVCSDVIRLFGEFAENPMVAQIPDDAWQTMAAKDTLRPGPIFAQPNKPKSADDIGKHWGHRDRLERAERVQVDKPFMPIRRDRVDWRGVEKFKFGDESVIPNIDYTYGLQIEGGDVSGTTADSIAALRWAASGAGNEDPVAQLIAIATMVPQGHHTIVECAWPLTRHGYMDYCIGFYDTLVPGGQDYADLRASLLGLDKDLRNQHLFVLGGSTRQRPLNFHFEKPDEIKEYRKIAGVRKAYSMCTGGKTDWRGAANMMRAHGVSDLVISRMSYWG